MNVKDETYVYIQDVKDKKNIARSARNARTHCGKSGSVKLPCDYMTKKEIRAMSGECKSYRLSEPMSWKEFKALPDDIKVTYIKLLREKFGVPDKEISDMFGVDRQTAGRWFRCLGLGLGKAAGGSKDWKKDNWYQWRSGDKVNTAEPEEIPVTDPEAILPEPDDLPCPVTADRNGSEETEVFPENHVADIRKKVDHKPAIPVRGELAFCGSAEDALKTAAVLLGGANVQISLLWEVIPEEAVD